MIHGLLLLSGKWFPVVPRYGLVVDNIFRGNQYYRLWSASWLHAHWTHWLLNAAMLLCLVYGTTSPLSGANFLFIYLVSCVGGNILALHVARGDHSGQPHAVGAAGGISGVLLASLTLSPSLIFTVPQLAVSLPLWPLAVIFLTVSVFTLKPNHSTLIHDAHLGGALVGLLLSPIVASEPLQTTLWLAIAILLPTVVLCYTLVKAPEVASSKSNGLLNDLDTSWEEATNNALDKVGYESLEEEMDALLDRIGQNGLRSLTVYEQKRLQTIANG